MHKRTEVWVILMALCLALIWSEPLVVAQGTSSNWRIDESSIGPGGNLDSSSSSYQLESGQQAVGNGGATEGASTNFQTRGGSVTTADPRLSCIINTSSVNFGTFSTSVPATATATFSVLNYTSYGYIVTLLGQPPTYAAHSLANMSSTGPSAAGTEQFGVNLVANTSPATFGANPSQNPSGTFSFGAAATNYNTANNYRYVSGETVASATKSSGQTDYTISYLVNVATTTPAGRYQGNQTVLCTGTF